MPPFHTPPPPQKKKKKTTTTKHQKTKDFLICGIKWEHQPEMGKENVVLG